MWRFVSAARMAQIKADARAEGYIKAVREGLAAYDAAKEDRIVTSDSAQTANTAVQEVQTVVKQASTKQQTNGNRLTTRGTVRKRVYKRSHYGDKNVVLITDGAQLEDAIAKMQGEMSYNSMSDWVRINMGTHVPGKVTPRSVTAPTIAKIAFRRLVWDKNLRYFVNVDGH